MKIDSFINLIETPIRKSFESIMMDEIEKIRQEAIFKIDKCCKEQKIKAQETAQKLTLSMLQKLDSDRIVLEFKRK